MLSKGRCLYRSSLCIIFVLVISCLYKTSYAQDMLPYQLSEAVQARAKEMRIWEQVINEGFGDPTFAYLDELTAADVMARKRAEHQRKTVPDKSDYDIMFASWCLPIPNKPPFPNFSAISKTIRRELSLSGVYLYDSRRSLLRNAMHRVLLEGDINNLYSILAEVRTIQDFNSRIFNSAFLAK
jgi:hypothetical protein